jgi:Holliday junction resolvasome RuvABC endonuclease subunit
MAKNEQENLKAKGEDEDLKEKKAQATEAGKVQGGLEAEHACASSSRCACSATRARRSSARVAVAEALIEQVGASVDALLGHSRLSRCDVASFSSPYEVGLHSRPVRARQGLSSEGSGIGLGDPIRLGWVERVRVFVLEPMTHSLARSACVRDFPLLAPSSSASEREGSHARHLDVRRLRGPGASGGRRRCSSSSLATQRRHHADHVPLPAALARWGYPQAYVEVAYDMARKFLALVDQHRPDVIVIEETNLGKNRYSQKMLEFLHCAFAERFLNRETKPVPDPKIVYLSSSSWRHALGLQMSKEDKRNNAKLSKAKRNAALYGTKLDKAALGIRGRVNKKHVAIRFVNSTYGLALLVKDDDIADAICLGLAYFQNAAQCDGVVG